MKETVATNVEKETAQLIQELEKCSDISLMNELTCMSNLWEKLTESDRCLIIGMVKGSVIALASKNK